MQGPKTMRKILQAKSLSVVSVSIHSRIFYLSMNTLKKIIVFKHLGKCYYNLNLYSKILFKIFCFSFSVHNDNTTFQWIFFTPHNQSDKILYSKCTLLYTCSFWILYSFCHQSSPHHVTKFYHSIVGTNDLRNRKYFSKKINCKIFCTSSSLDET